jgi:hypothetical protein
LQIFINVLDDDFVVVVEDDLVVLIFFFSFKLIKNELKKPLNNILIIT